MLRGKEGKVPITPDLIFGADETGIQEGLSTCEYVYSPKGKNVQHQQRSGKRDNTTSIKTICADGTVLHPTIIFKGNNFQMAWNGYTEGDITYLWLVNINKQTAEKAGGRHQLFIVDGHQSRITVKFLVYTQQHNIHVLCYPLHSTHIFQGLDDIIFGSSKQPWSEEHDHYELSRGVPVTKCNFLEVHAKAHAKAFTVENIIVAFRKTGVVPFNPDVIGADVMAPSITTSSQGHQLWMPSP
ncbi:hypothetical protein PLEOSDRAFT_1049211, partial [Pleurotus ostreatus PC15]